MRYKLNNFEFELYAYEFHCTEDSKAYFKRATGKESENDATFTAWGSFFTHTLVVIDNERAYIVQTTPKDAEAINQFFAENFSKRLF